MWANVGKSLNCIIAKVDKLIERDSHNEEGAGGSSSKDGEADPTLEDSITSHSRGKNSFFTNHWLSKENEKNHDQ